MGTKRECKVCHLPKQLESTLGDIKALLGIVNIGLHLMSVITDYFSQAWVNKVPFISDVFPRDVFLLLFCNLPLAYAEMPGKLKKSDLTKSVSDIIRSKFIMHYLPSTTVTADKAQYLSSGGPLMRHWV
jgi:hypothetical protein